MIASDGVWGAGLSVSYANIEWLEIDGMEGDDHFFIVSSSEKYITVISGNLGSDTFDLSGDVTETIVSLDPSGLSGTIQHEATSDDPNYNGIAIPDVAITSGTSSSTSVVLTESDSLSQLTEGLADYDIYTLRLIAEPTANVYPDHFSTIRQYG